MISDEQRQNYERQGEAKVRARVMMYQPPVQDEMFEWLREIEAERQCSRSRQRRSDRRLDVTAIVIATIAMIMATIGAIPTIKLIIEHLSRYGPALH